VQGFASSQPAAVRQAQVPPSLVQVYAVPPHEIVWHSVCVVELQNTVVPPPHVPLARFSPQPEQVRPVVTLFVPQTSAQEPAAVPQPDPAEQVTVQHWLPPPTAQVVWDAVHEQALHTSPVPEQYRVQPAG
jgi:hypothetical protein